MEINHISVNANFKYLWLKTVKGVDLEQHCARCLKGEYDKRISPAMKEGRGIALEDSVYYLCGVAQPFNGRRTSTWPLCRNPAALSTMRATGSPWKSRGRCNCPFARTISTSPTQRRG